MSIVSFDAPKGSGELNVASDDEKEAKRHRSPNVSLVLSLIGLANHPLREKSVNETTSQATDTIQIHRAR